MFPNPGNLPVKVSPSSTPPHPAPPSEALKFRMPIGIYYKLELGQIMQTKEGREHMLRQLRRPEVSVETKQFIRAALGLPPAEE